MFAYRPMEALEVNKTQAQAALCFDYFGNFWCHTSVSQSKEVKSGCNMYIRVICTYA